mmetsp:Transcript_10799/g.20501  ORF Transcript_10799/g.20501 Transcript_10799/m.20501 type:complete len:182 (+) Transcript_10799:86-631(+)
MDVNMLEFSAKNVTDVVSRQDVATSQADDGLNLELKSGFDVDQKEALTIVASGVEAFGSGSHGSTTARAARIKVQVSNATLQRDSSAVLYIVDIGSEPSPLSDSVRKVVSAKAARQKDANSLCKESVLMHSIRPHMRKNSKIVLMAHVTPTDALASLETLQFAHQLLAQVDAPVRKKKGSS